MASKKSKVAAAVVALILLLLLIIAGWIIVRSMAPGSDAEIATPPATRPETTAASVVTEPSPPAPVVAKIKVGLIVSALNAKSFGYDRQTRLLPELRDSSFDIYPIIDPGSESDHDLLTVLLHDFPGKKAVDGGAVAQLAALDVLAVEHCSSLPQPELDAIESAVSNGKGLLIRMFLEPGGQTPQTLRLSGLKDGRYYYLQKGLVPCQVVGSHPILGKLSGTDVQMNLQPNGLFGTINGIALINVAPGQTMPGFAEGATFSPLFVATLGKGSIVDCAFAGSKAVPDALEHAGPDHFTIRAVKWLAEQSRAASAGSTTIPATQPAAF